MYQNGNGGGYGNDGLDDLFDRIGNAQDMGGSANRLQPGQHRVALALYTTRRGKKKQNQVIVEGKFMILASTPLQGFAAHQVGEIRDWAWFPGSDGFGYADDRSKKFIQTVAACLGDTRVPKEIGLDMTRNQKGRGVVLDVMVTLPPPNADGTPKTNQKGELITNAEWRAVQQTPEQIAQIRAQIDQIAPIPVAPQGGFQQGPGPQGFQQQGYPQGQPQGGFPNQGGWPQQGAPMQQQGYPQGQPQPQGYPQQQAVPATQPPQGGYPNPFPTAGAPVQGYPQQPAGNGPQGWGQPAPQQQQGGGMLPAGFPFPGNNGGNGQGQR